MLTISSFSTIQQVPREVVFPPHLKNSTMKLFVALAALALAVAQGAPQYQAVRTVEAVTRAKPIAIVRSNLNSPGSPGYERSFRSSFESENGIQQSSEGELRQVGDSEVMVMSGSYSYIGTDSQTYVVDWYADETGFHASAPHLPQPVEIPFPEQAAAVEAQIRFAAEENNAEASNTYVTPVASPSQVRTVVSPVVAPAQVRVVNPSRARSYAAPVELVEVRSPVLTQYSGYQF